MYFSDISGEKKTAFFAFFREMTVNVHKIKRLFSLHIKKLPDDKIQKVAIIQIKTPHAIHLPPLSGYNQNADRKSVSIMKQEEES